MLTNEYRPQNFSDMVGHTRNVQILKAIIEHPEKSPRVIILHGQYGCGKTTSARILAWGLNCQHNCKHFVGKHPCGGCQQFSEVSYSPKYQEYDSSDVGRVEVIREIKDSLMVSGSLAKWRVIVFDEFHLASRQAQSALLKVLEEVPGNIFFVFCTTDISKIIPTIRSRAIELLYDLVASEDILKLLTRINDKEQFGISERTLQGISIYCRGHVRDSVMLLDQCRLVGEQVFVDSLGTSEIEIINLFLAARSGDKESYKSLIESVSSCILEVVKADFYNVIKNAMRMVSTKESPAFFAKYYEALVNDYGPEGIIKLFMLSMQPWSSSAFSSDVVLQSFLWYLFYSMAKKAAPTFTPTTSAPDIHVSAPVQQEVKPTDLSTVFKSRRR